MVTSLSEEKEDACDLTLLSSSDVRSSKALPTASLGYASPLKSFQRPSLPLSFSTCPSSFSATSGRSASSTCCGSSASSPFASCCGCSSTNCCDCCSTCGSSTGVPPVGGFVSIDLSVDVRWLVPVSLELEVRRDRLPSSGPAETGEWLEPSPSAIDASQKATAPLGSSKCLHSAAVRRGGAPSVGDEEGREKNLSTGGCLGHRRSGCRCCCFRCRDANCNPPESSSFFNPYILDFHIIGVSKGRIVCICPTGSFYCKYRSKQRMDISKRPSLLLPGLVNCHQHSPMTLLRGAADDLPLKNWLEDVVFPIERKLVTPSFVRLGSQIAVYEMLKTGTTMFNDMYFFPECTVEVCRRARIRVVSGPVLFDVPDGSTALAVRTPGN
eukprot:GHVT01093767.1.p1 GENE.GHVT01093767.1~~GHVT01093767.1.p1  ORF type:complete len:383 (-),score=62.11 GHVT01093767.1:36-1184(-)